MSAPQNIRVDLQHVADLVAPKSRLLDVGCGDGALLAYLKVFRQVDGRGLELSMSKVRAAVSQGLPVIITPNTGGADLVIEGQTGFLVPIRSPETIAQKIAWFDDNRRELPAMKAAAMRHAAGYTWQHYGELVVDAIRESN